MASGAMAAFTPSHQALLAATCAMHRPVLSCRCIAFPLYRCWRSPYPGAPPLHSINLTLYKLPRPNLLHRCVGAGLHAARAVHAPPAVPATRAAGGCRDPGASVGGASHAHQPQVSG